MKQRPRSIGTMQIPHLLHQGCLACKPPCDAICRMCKGRQHQAVYKLNRITAVTEQFKGGHSLQKSKELVGLVGLTPVVDPPAPPRVPCGGRVATDLQEGGEGAGSWLCWLCWLCWLTRVVDPPAPLSDHFGPNSSRVARAGVCTEAVGWLVGLGGWFVLVVGLFWFAYSAHRRRC